MTSHMAMPGIGVWVIVRATGQQGRVTAHAGPPGAPTLASVHMGETFGMFTAAELDVVDVRFSKPVLPPLTGKQTAAVVGAWTAWGAALAFLIGFVVVCIGMSVQ